MKRSLELLVLFLMVFLISAVGRAAAMDLGLSAPPGSALKKTVAAPIASQDASPDDLSEAAGASEGQTLQNAPVYEYKDYHLPEPVYAFGMPSGHQKIPQAEIVVRLDRIASGINQPVDLVSLPEDSTALFVVDHGGTIYRISPRSDQPLEQFMDLRSLPEVGDQGLELHALVFHPEFSLNGRFYVYYTFTRLHEALQDWTRVGRLSEFSLSSLDLTQGDHGSERILLEFEPLNRGDDHLRFYGLPDGSIVLTLAEKASAPGKAICIEPDPLQPVQLDCRQHERLFESDWVESGAIVPEDYQDGFEFTGGRLYDGPAFPSLHGRAVFAGNPAAGRVESRLFAARLPNPDAQAWRIEELHYFLDDGGPLNEPVTGIGKDSSGELYVLTAGGGDDRNRGSIYRIAPRINAERSVIDGLPEEYLPLEYRYARVVRRVPVYRTLEDVRSGDPFDSHGGGNYWVSIRSSAQVNGSLYYRIAWGWGSAAWIAARYVLIDAPLSHLAGVNLAESAVEPLAIAYRAVQIRSQPGVLSDDVIVGVLQPYDVVRVYERRQVGEAIWYRIGPDQWSHGNYLRVFATSPRPEEVGPDEKWVEVNLAEQIVIAHQGDRPVFATLTSTGRPGYETKKGLFQVWAIIREGPMRWEDSRQPYNLANVPWIMYFNQGQGLHGAYWHDQFGTVRSAGCVNLSPRDAYWLFHWAAPAIEPDQRIFYPGDDDPEIWVWVHDNRPDLDAMIADYLIKTVQLPGGAGRLD
jgi:hypothetical protein